MQNTIKILIDLKKEMYRFDQAQQGDDVILDITLLENGVAKDLTGETVELIYINANNTVASVTGDKIIVSGNNVKITCPTDCTRSYGIAKFQLKIISTYQVSTFPIALTIVPSVDQNQQISQNISTILEDLTSKNIECGETLESLKTWISTGNLLNADLESNIGTGTLLNTDLEDNITTVTQLKTVLSNVINTGNELDTSLEEKINIGNPLDLALKVDTETANTAKENLQNVIATADTTTYATQGQVTEINSQLADIVINVTNPPIGYEKIGGDGTDETASLLALINYVADNHYTLLIPKSIQITIDNINITNKSNFGVMCEGTIKRKDNSTTGTLLRFTNCSDVSIPLIKFDGNGTNNGCIENIDYTANEEHKHCMVFEGCTNIKGEIVEALNSCGDIVYISNSSKNIKFTKVTGRADTQIGRNVVSIISGQDIYIDHIYSDNFGHFDMPGGFDIEPNANTETVRNVFIKDINLTGGGSAPCAVLASNGANTSNVYIGSVNLNRTLAYTTLTESESVYITGKNVYIDNINVKNSTIHKINYLRLDSHGVMPTNIIIKDGYGENCYRGISVGLLGQNVDGIKLKSKLKNLGYDGLYLLACTNSLFDIDIDSVGATRAMVTKSGAYATDNITIRGNISKRGTGTAALLSSADPSFITNWTLENLDFTGWEVDKKLFGGGWLGTVRKINCKGLTHQPNRPTFERWKVGDIVYNTNPSELGTTGSKYIVEKWICVADGAGTVSNFLESRTLTGN